MTPKHRQAFTGSGIQLPQAGKRKANTKWEGCTRRKSTRGKSKGKPISHIKRHCYGPINKVTEPSTLAAYKYNQRNLKEESENWL